MIRDCFAFGQNDQQRTSQWRFFAHSPICWRTRQSLVQRGRHGLVANFTCHENRAPDRLILFATADAEKYGAVDGFACRGAA
jgi:hypothetical protein